ncbi:hypothetical protein FRC03_001880 [Tulasnella sp. 419]|nr:hypothetical protein FRC03_001880 [Tulasnella sp. 419]
MKTVFTFSVLRNFQLHATLSTTSCYDYFKILMRMTVGAQGDKTNKNRYRELLIIMRVWHWIQALKHGGQAFGIGEYLLKHHSDSVATLCGACPQPHINMDPKVQFIDPSKKHKHAVYLAEDATFSLDRRLKAGDPNDFCLVDGVLYFIKKANFKMYLDKINEDSEPSTCSGFRASDVLCEGRYKYTATSGVLAVICARHGFYLPNGMVDLQKGERFSHADYALHGPLEAYQSLITIFHSYDVACQWRKKAQIHFEAHRPDLVPIVRRLIHVLPKMHAIAHQGPCRYTLSFNFTPHAGRTDGEQIERNWSKSKSISGSSREMSEGHREDFLNLFHDAANFQRLVDSSRDLHKRLANATLEQDNSLKNFEQLSASLSQDLVENGR